jgi:DNA-binding transcriptional ArsR family regulator
LRALTFITKRGEGTFDRAHKIRPYFRERADWQYVSAILETTLREKLKFERSWIMKVCRGAQSLEDVQRNVVRDLQRARGLNESVLTTLEAHLELVLPQIAATSFAPAVELARGINVMDLSEFRLELQSLIIRSALEWIYEREDNTVVIIPGGKPAHRREEIHEEERMCKEKYEALRAEAEQTKRELEALKAAKANTMPAAEKMPASPNGAVDLDAIYGYVRSRLLKEQDPGVMEVLSRRPEVRVKVERPVLQFDESTLRGRLAHLIADGFFDDAATGSAAFAELKRRGFGTSRPNVYKELDRLAEMGMVTKEPEGYQKAAGAVIKTASA